jgi:hypothetical protein
MIMTDKIPHYPEDAKIRIYMGPMMYSKVEVLQES